MSVKLADPIRARILAAKSGRLGYTGICLSVASTLIFENAALGGSGLLVSAALLLNMRRLNARAAGYRQSQHD